MAQFMMKQREINIIISGHSTDSNLNSSKKFNLKQITQKNICKILYSSEKGESCFIGNSNKLIFDEYDRVSSTYMSNPKKYKKIHDNYNIQFDTSNPTNGIFSLNSTNGNRELERIIEPTESMSLFDIVKNISDRHNGFKINFYCFFCRGSKREKFGSFQPVNNYNGLNFNGLNSLPPPPQASTNSNGNGSSFKRIRLSGGKRRKITKKYKKYKK